MTEITTPDLSRDLNRIHKVITRGLSIGTAGGDEFRQDGFPDPAVKKGYVDYVQTLGMVLEAHHLSEEEIVFPIFVEKMVIAPYERLTADHREISRLVGSLRRGAGDVAAEGDTDDLSLLVDTLRRIHALWVPHIAIEEECFASPALVKAMTPEEQGKLGADLGKFSSEHSGPPALAVPFVLFNLDPVDRAAMTANLPKALVEELVPVTWKEMWAPMKPFLLD